MKLIIDILEEEYKMLVNPHQFLFNEHTFDNLRESIKNGTPLPKGHGRLIDANALVYSSNLESVSMIEIGFAPTIIEADRGDAE